MKSVPNTRIAPQIHPDDLRRLSLDLHTLFMLGMIFMWITITIYFDFSHVSIYFSNKFNV